MTEKGAKRLFVFVPPLSALLANKEEAKGKPLTREEVLEIRDSATCVAMSEEEAQQVESKRGYKDIDPANIWQEWQQVRKGLGAKSEAKGPAPRFVSIASDEPNYRKTIEDARSRLDEFRQMLSSDDAPRYRSMVKTKILQGEEKHYLWLSNVRNQEPNFVGEFVCAPASLREYKTGDEFEVKEEAVLDWMVNDEGDLYGGFSIRYRRSLLKDEEERNEYDRSLDVKRYM